MRPSPPINDRSASTILAGSRPEAPKLASGSLDWPTVTPPICRATRRPLAHPDPLTLRLQQIDRLKRSVQNHQPNRSG